jgi:glycine cleavage system H protein
MVMKELDEFNFPVDLRYAETHEWVRVEGDKVILGITDYAQDHLGDLTFIELPQEGDEFKKGEQCGTLESTKAVSEIFTPVSGEIVAVNAELAESPGLVNSDPYGNGWLVSLKAQDIAEIDELMTADDYRKMLEGLE